MTALENRFDTILPTLATKADVKGLELKLAESSAQHRNSLNRLEISLLDIIHQEIKAVKRELHQEIKTVKQELHQEIQSVCQKIDSNNWRMIAWLTTVVITGFAGVFYVARYVPPA